MASAEALRRRVTQRCADCRARESGVTGTFRKDELAAILGALAPVRHPERMSTVGLRLSIGNALDLDTAGERAFHKREIESISSALRERQEVQA